MGGLRSVRNWLQCCLNRAQNSFFRGPGPAQQLSNEATPASDDHSTVDGHVELAVVTLDEINWHLKPFTNQSSEPRCVGGGSCSRLAVHNLDIHGEESTKSLASAGRPPDGLES